MRSAAAIDARRPALEHRAEDEIVDRRPARIGLRDRVLVEFAGHRPAPFATQPTMRSRAARSAARRQRLRGCDRALDEAAAEHARLAVGRIVEHAGLAGRHAFLAVDQLDLDAAGAAAQPRRLRRARRAHLDEDLAPAGAQRSLDRAVADPVHVAQRDAPRRERLARADHDAARCRVEAHHVERLAGRDAEPAPLADGVMDDAVMAAEHAAVEIDDVAGLGGVRACSRSITSV